MRLRFTKMQGAGNDFVVLDATRGPLSMSSALTTALTTALSPAQMRHLGDRRFGVGADQILVVDASNEPGIDFGYRIFNGGSGDEVEHCGNGARCFLRYVLAHGLTTQRTVRVRTVNRVLELSVLDNGEVRVDMGRPEFAHALIPFDSRGLEARDEGGFELWPLALPAEPSEAAEVAVLSMGNPHAVRRVANVDDARVGIDGPATETHPRFAQGVNAGFMQVLARDRVRLRVWERGAGETLACGTGACAAVVAGVRLGWLDSQVRVDARGGTLHIEWAGGDAPVRMSGPAETVYEGEIEL